MSFSHRFILFICCLYIVIIYLNLLNMWSLRMVKCVSYPQRKKSCILKGCTGIFFTWPSDKFTELIFSILLSAYYFHGSYHLEWPHHLIIKSRILGVILTSSLSSMYYIQISKFWCFCLLCIWCYLNSSPYHCYLDYYSDLHGFSCFQSLSSPSWPLLCC